MLGLGLSPALKSGLRLAECGQGQLLLMQERPKQRRMFPFSAGTPNPGILFCVSGAEHPLFAPALVTDELFPLRGSDPALQGSHVTELFSLHCSRNAAAQATF